MGIALNFFFNKARLSGAADFLSTFSLGLGFFYYFFMHGFIFKFFRGALLKGESLYVFFNFLFLHFLCVLIKNSSVLNISSLVDFVVSDYPQRLKRFDLCYCFLSHCSGFRFFFKTIASTVLFSAGTFFSSAFWLEREAWDLFGLRFLFHGDLRRILTDYGFRGHPLRKDFPLTGFVEVRYDDSFSAVLSEAVEFTQSLRVYIFANPWSFFR